MDARAYDIMRRTGGKIKISWDERDNAPGNAASMITGTISAAIHTDVQMTKSSWRKLCEMERLKVHQKVLGLYDFGKDKRLFNWVESVVVDIFKGWKTDLHRHYKNNGKESPPAEFVPRWLGKWQWLVNHFESAPFKRKSAENIVNCKNLTEHHHCGPMPFGTRMKKHLDQGDKMPFITNYIVVYPGAHHRHGKLKEAVDEHIQKHYPNTPLEDLQLLDLDAQAQICAKALGSRPGNHVRGLGRVGDGILTLPSTRGSSRCHVSAVELEEAQTQLHHATEKAQQAENQCNELEGKYEALQAQYDVVQTSYQGLHTKYDLVSAKLDMIISQLGIQSTCGPPLRSRTQDDDGDGRNDVHATNLPGIDLVAFEMMSQEIS